MIKQLKINSTKIVVLTFLLSMLIPLLLIQTSGFPYFGLSVFFSTIATLIYIYKPEKNKIDVFLFTCVYFYSLFLIIRANHFVTLINILTLIYLDSLLLLNNGVKASFIRVFFSPINAFLNVLSSKNAFNYRLKNVSKTQDILQEHLVAFILTIFILLITIPLLAYANPFFNELINTIIKGLKITDFLKEFYIHIIRFIVFSILLFLFPRLIYVASIKKTVNVELKIISSNLLIPKIVLTVILIIFFITQAQLYFSSADTLKNLGYTNSQYAREVFAQLSVVAGIILLLIFNDTGKYRLKSLLTYFLMLEAFFLSFIAFKSVLDYTNTWGFTHKRLYGYAGVFWLIGALYLAFYQFKNKLNNTFYITRIIILTTAVLFAINFSNFDYMIYHYRKTTLPTGTDFHYLSNLSVDSMSYSEQMDYHLKQIQENKTYSYNETLPAFRLLNSIRYIQDKYRKIPALGALNLAELTEYYRVKNLNTKDIQDKLDQLITPNPSFKNH